MRTLSKGEQQRERSSLCIWIYGEICILYMYIELYAASIKSEKICKPLRCAPTINRTRISQNNVNARLCPPLGAIQPPDLTAAAAPVYQTPLLYTCTPYVRQRGFCRLIEQPWRTPGNRRNRHSRSLQPVYPLKPAKAVPTEDGTLTDSINHC